MASFHLTDQAEADFDSIGLYTLETWGAVQAASYLGELDQAFHDLSQDATLGRMRRDVQPDLWSLRCNHHLIFFRRDAEGNVAVLRVLHERMDIDRHV